MSEKEKRSLYRFEYYEPANGEFYIDWLWLEDSEVLPYATDNDAIFRPATKDEEGLYNEAYADGYAASAIAEFSSTYDGITYSVEFNNSLESGFSTKKVFQCAICDNHLDFEEKVACAGGMYLGAIRDDKLWHVCHDCAQGNAEIDWIDQGWVWDDDSGSTNEKSS